MKKNNHQAPRERNYGMGSEKIVNQTVPAVNLQETFGLQNINKVNKMHFSAHFICYIT